MPVSTLTGEAFKNKQVLLHFLNVIKHLTNWLLSYFERKFIVKNYLHFHCRILLDERSTGDWNHIFYEQILLKFCIQWTLSMTMYIPCIQFWIKSVLPNFCFACLLIWSLLNLSGTLLSSIVQQIKCRMVKFLNFM